MLVVVAAAPSANVVAAPLLRRVLFASHFTGQNNPGSELGDAGCAAVERHHGRRHAGQDAARPGCVRTRLWSFPQTTCVLVLAKEDRLAAKVAAARLTVATNPDPPTSESNPQKAMVVTPSNRSPAG